MTIKIKQAFLPQPSLHGLNNARPQKAVMRQGDPISYDMLHNCLTCSRWADCRDPAKRSHYRCSRYREATIEETDIESIMADMVPESTGIMKEKEFHTNDMGEEDLVALIERVLSANIPVPPDIKIDDKEIPEAKNFLEWSTSDKFGGGGMPPFPRQLEIGTKLWGEWCVRCSDTEWFDEMPVDAPISEIQDRVVFLEHGICPNCKVTRSELVLKKELQDSFSLLGIAGQRASKSTSVILWDSYNLHRMLKLPSPAGIYSLLPSQPLVATHTAMTFGQSVENTWMPFKNVLTGAAWFANYHNFLDRRGQELGEELYTISETFARYRNRNLFLSPASPSKRTMRGRSRFSALVDELSWFPLARKGDKKGGNGNDFERLDARGVRDALLNSLFTVKVAYKRRLEEGFNVPKPMFYAVSSPQATNDALMTMYREAKNSKEVYTFLYPTWEYNPQIKRDDLDEYFRNDPVAASRDFACVPPIGEGLFLQDVSSLRKLFKNKTNGISVSTAIGLSKTQQKITTSRVKLLTNSVPVYPTILCVDVGLVSNSFAFSICGLPDDYDPDITPEERGTLLTPMQVFAVGEVIPTNGTRISLTHLYDGCLRPLVDDFDIAYFVSDRWNNVKLSQDLEEQHEVTPFEYQCKWRDFENLRDLLYTGNVSFPRLEQSPEDILQTTLDDYPNCFRRRPVDHLFWQLASVKEQTNVTVVKGDGSTDDLFRTIVLGASMLQDDEVFEYIITNRNEQEARETGAIGLSHGYSKGRSASAGTGNSIQNNGRVVAVMTKFGNNR
jgi:hypothetical protein